MIAKNNDHWFAIFISTNEIQIVDPIGLIWKNPPLVFINFLCSHSSKTLSFNSIYCNSNSNLTCLYVLFFVKMKSLDWSWENNISFFDDKVTDLSTRLKNLMIR